MNLLNPRMIAFTVGFLIGTVLFDSELKRSWYYGYGLAVIGVILIGQIVSALWLLINR